MTADLLNNILNDIENGIKEDINIDAIAKKYNLSGGHLLRLFKLFYKQSLGKYIRIRKLMASLDDLLYTNFHIIDIALAYGYDYEQSYIRAFKKEYGITPGNLRKSGLSVKVKPPPSLE